MTFESVVRVVLVCVLVVSLGCSSSDQVINSPVVDGPCSDNTGNRFVVCGNGTVTDTQTGLIWLQTAYSCFGLPSWTAATAAAGDLKSGECYLMDGSSAGDWRLPTKEEWEAILKPSCNPVPGPPALPDKAGTGCYREGWWVGPLPLDHYYWSSTELEVGGNFAWVVTLREGGIGIQGKSQTHYVWPVRGGQ